MLLPLLLLAAAYLLIEAGLQFVGILAAVIGVLLLFTGGEKKHSGVTVHEPMGPNGPIVVEQKLPPIPNRVFIKYKPNWMDRANFEYTWEHTGWWVDRLFRWLFYQFSRKPGGKK